MEDRFRQEFVRNVRVLLAGVQIDADVHHSRTKILCAIKTHRLDLVVDITMHSWEFSCSSTGA